MLIFGNLCQLPRMGNIVATATATVDLYTEWVVATAQVAPMQGMCLVEEFITFSSTGATSTAHSFCTSNFESSQIICSID